MKLIIKKALGFFFFFSLFFLSPLGFFSSHFPESCAEIFTQSVPFLIVQCC